MLNQYDLFILFKNNTRQKVQATYKIQPVGQTLDMPGLGISCKDVGTSPVLKVKKTFDEKCPQIMTQSWWIIHEAS